MGWFGQPNCHLTARQKAAVPSARAQRACCQLLGSAAPRNVQPGDFWSRWRAAKGRSADLVLICARSSLLVYLPLKLPPVLKAVLWLCDPFVQLAACALLLQWTWTTLPRQQSYNQQKRWKKNRNWDTASVKQRPKKQQRALSPVQRFKHPLRGSKVCCSSRFLTRKLYAKFCTGQCLQTGTTLFCTKTPS